MVKRKNTISRQEFKRQQTKTLLQAHKPRNQIAKFVGITFKSVSNISKRKRVERRKASGRKEILDKRNKLRIIHLVRHNPFLSAEDIQVQLQLPCTPRTICNYLHKAGFKRCKPRTEPPLDDEMIEERIVWCRSFKTSRTLSRTIFTDEAGFWIFDNNKVGWFKSDYSDPLLQDQYSGKLNVWCAISCKGKVGIEVFTKNLNSTKYIEILSNYLIPNADRLFQNNWFLQQDKHPTHRSIETTRFLNNNIEVIDWPRYSADLSPVENLWPILKRNVRKRQPQTAMELEDYIYEEWDQLDNKYISSLCKSIHNRIEMCIENNGEKIKY